MTALPALTQPANRVSPLLITIAMAHAINDLFQAVLPSLYPVLQSQYGLSYAQLGLLTLMFHLIGSLCQPLVGWHTDRRPCAWLLPCAMLCMGAGMVLLAYAEGFTGFMLAAALVGLGSSIFHPEGSRAARAVCAGRPGLAQSVFQLGGNLGSAAAPLLLATVLLMPIAQLGWWMAALAVAGWLLLRSVVRSNSNARLMPVNPPSPLGLLPARRKVHALSLLVVLVLSKYVYLACIANFYTFFLIERFAMDIRQAQLYLFAFLAAITLGSLLGGPLVDRLGRRRVIVLSILGACPFALGLPLATPGLVLGLSLLIGVIIASAFAAILLMAQDLLPGRIGLVAGAFFGLTFGISGIGAAGLGVMADRWGVIAIFGYASCLPLLGLLALALPRDDDKKPLRIFRDGIS